MFNLDYMYQPELCQIVNIDEGWGLRVVAKTTAHNHTLGQIPYLLLTEFDVPTVRYRLRFFLLQMKRAGHKS